MTDLKTTALNHVFIKPRTSGTLSATGAHTGGTAFWPRAGPQQGLEIEAGEAASPAPSPQAGHRHQHTGRGSAPTHTPAAPCPTSAR